MAITYGDAGTNRTISAVTYGDAGVNRTLAQIWFGDGGVNRLVFAPINLQGLDPTDIKVSPTTAQAVYSLTNGGLEQATG